jgi:dihydrofolate synthase / folylpolyglutamate synthase
MHPSDDFADLIEPFSRRGVDLGLDRLQAALAELDHPERRFEAVQVAGTNGKGSICTLVHQGLLAAGIDAGALHLAASGELVRAHSTGGSGHQPGGAAAPVAGRPTRRPAPRPHPL